MTLQYSITPADHLEMIKVVRINRARRLLSIWLSLVGIALSGLIYAMEREVWPILVALFIGITMVVQICLPQIIHRRIYKRNPRLFGPRTIMVANEGIKAESEISRVETKWSSFEKFVETPNLFLLYQTRDVVGIIPKRAFGSQEELASFRSLLGSKVRQT